MDAPRILLLTENHPPDRGGMSESCDRIVRGLRRLGATIDVMHFDRRGGEFRHQVVTRGSILTVPALADPAHAINRLWNQIRARYGDVPFTQVVAFGGYLPILAAPSIAAFLDVPLLTLFRGNELDAGLFDFRRRYLLDDAIARSAVICAVTTEQKEKLESLHPSVRVELIANGIDLDLWAIQDSDRDRARRWRNEHVDPSKRVISFVGHLKAKKGVPFFLESLRRSGVMVRTHLLFVGEGDDTLRAWLDQHGASVSFSRVPLVDRFDLIPYYLASDAVAIPSHYDGYPNVMIEAAAAGVPLMASEVGGMRDLLTDGENAILFSPDDDQECRKAIARFVAMPDEALKRLGEAARAAVHASCDARAEAASYFRLLSTPRIETKFKPELFAREN